MPKLRIFLPPTAPVQEMSIKSANWDSFEIDEKDNLVVKLGSVIVVSFSRGQYIGAIRDDAIVP